MSLTRFYNTEKLLQLNTSQYGQEYSNEDLSLLTTWQLSPYDPKLIDANISEVHLFTLNGDYLGNDNNAKYIVLDDVSNTLLVDLRQVFHLAGIDRGAYRIVINLLKPIFGDEQNSPFFIKEISPDRTELQLNLIPNSDWKNRFPEFQLAIDGLKGESILNHVVLNFGFNRLAKVANIKFKQAEGIFYVKLYDELREDIAEKASGWAAFELMDPYVDSVSLTSPVTPVPGNKMLGPNWDIEIGLSDSNSTVYKSWNDLLDSDTPTRQRIIDTFLSGSNSAQLNIDYTDFGNFVFYGSAEDRIDNFKYKLQLVEYYKKQIGTLNQSSGSALIPALQSNISIYNKRVDNLISSFSQFEKWLYYEPTASIFTHDISGSIKPFPKYVQNGLQKVYHTTSSRAVSWYNGAIATASYYDELVNYNRLYHSIPEHILIDSNNSQYITFVNMIAEHFDDLYAYTRALTSIHERDEHPQRGMPNELLPIVAESMGWQVQNTKQISDLWLYALGTNQSGSYQDTGSLYSLSHRNLNYQVWRRIVNNMPFLLKTKGTTRSLKALLSIYGIPHTLISIKEFGGPSKENSKPQLIEDRFAYRLNFKGKNFIRLARTKLPISSGSWTGPTRVPDTVEFRFKTNYSSSVSMSLLALENSTPSQLLFNLDVVHSRSIYSGSYDYGYLRFRIASGSSKVYSGSSAYIPIFDNDMWNVRMWTDTPITNAGTGSINFEIQKAADCVDGAIFHSSSFSVSLPTNTSTGWGHTHTGVKHRRLILGGSTGSAWAGRPYAHRFSGSIHAYKEYYEVLNKETFNEHTINPGAYHGNSPTSSYYTLYRYFPLGVETIRHDHTVTRVVTSSQPNRNITFNNSASFISFTGTQATQYEGFRETHYIYTPSIGGQNIMNEKIRIESNELKYDLSHEASAERSRYDFAPVDTNKIAVVFAPSDQTNRDIFNHTGFTELDDYIGDPEHEFENQYRDLKNFAEEYWKKYARRYNINEFIKIFSVYDYTIFEQIKQLIPARADLIHGVLIEPNVLERSKVHLTKRPSVENPQYEKTINVIQSTTNGEYLTYTSSIAATGSIESTYHYLKGSLPLTASLESLYSVYRGVLPTTASLEADYNYYTSSIRIEDPYTGSKGETGSIVDQCRTTCRYKRVIYHYSSSANHYLTEYKRSFATYVSRSYKWFYSRSLVDGCYQIDECSPYNRARFVGSKLTGPDFNIDSSETIDGGPVVWYKETNPNKIIIQGDGPSGNLRVE